LSEGRGDVIEGRSGEIWVKDITRSDLAFTFTQLYLNIAF